MPRVCTVCTHKEREDIEKALDAGKTLRVIAEQYGLSIAAISRHRRHMEDKTEDTKKTKKPWDPEKDPVPKPPISDDPELCSVNGLGLVCPRCGEMELYFGGWLDKDTAIIECPWCPHTGLLKGFTVGSIALNFDDASEIAYNAPKPARVDKKK